MKIAVAVVVLAWVALGIFMAWRRSGVRCPKNETYDELKRLPIVTKDFTTPEGAILCLEDAYRRRDIEAAIAAKDFNTEARLMLERTGFKDFIDDAMIAKTAEALTLSFRTHTTSNWPNFEGLESYFPKKEQQADKLVLVTEVCRFPDGGFSRQQILVAETAQGWRVLNPVSK